MRNIFAVISLARAVGNAVAIDAPIPGYGVEDLQWEVQAFPDGPKMNVTGTVEQVRAQLTKLNPNYGLEFGIEKRFGPVCGGGSYGWKAADAKRILEGISYLRGVGGQPTNGPGPGNCGRVSCSYNSAIWWCNDNTDTFSLPSYSTIADCAQWVVGQNFNGYNWNCVVRDDRC
ncbi:hypothetical protein GQ53DRAFT_777319 [Thozetella sp. PMI_491]|nr:hypothetical protein GQ53DRAFT_777319 [Thozetella sp. PMI_491]